MKERLWQKVERLTRELFKTRRELRRTKTELTEIMRDVKVFLSPPGGQCDDTHFYSLCVCHEKEAMDCPFIMCGKWFENSEFMNCERYLQLLARREGGLPVGVLAQIKNLFGEGGLEELKIRGLEVRAVGKLMGSLRGMASEQQGKDGPYLRYIQALFGTLDKDGWRRLEARIETGGGIEALEKLIAEERKRVEAQNGRHKTKRRAGSEGTAAANIQSPADEQCPAGKSGGTVGQHKGYDYPGRRFGGAAAR